MGRDVSIGAIGAIGAAFLFGFADARQQKLELLNTGIPTEFLLMAPFLVTILVVAGFLGGTTAPAHDGIAYVKKGIRARRSGC